MPEIQPNYHFATLFKTLRMRAGIYTLQALAHELDESGITVDPSLLSHWQRGARLPRDRETILLLIKVFVDKQGIVSIEEANTFSASAGMGYLTEEEQAEFFGQKAVDDQIEIHNTTHCCVYFSAAIAQAKELEHNYRTIVRTLEEEGCQVHSKHIIGKPLTEIQKQLPQERLIYYRQFLAWLDEADIVVLEGSYPSSINIGHELTVALAKGKPVILFYQEGRDFMFLQGIRAENFFVVEYTDEQLAESVKNILHFVQHHFRKR